MSESSMVERRSDGATSVIVLSDDCVEYYVTNASGALVWTTTVKDGPRGQRAREAAARLQRDIFARQ